MKKIIPIAHKITGFFAAGCLAFSCMPAQAFADVAATTNQDESVFSVDCFTFGVTSGTNVKVTSVNAKASGAVVIPSQVTSPSSGISYSVTELSTTAIGRCESVTSLSIPASVSCTGCPDFQYCTSLESVDVASGNPSFKSVDGVLYSADMKSLLLYPQGKTEAEFDVPESVRTVYARAFYENKHIEAVSFSGDLTGSAAEGDTSSLTRGGIRDYAFYECANLKSVTFAPGMKIAYIPLYSSGLGTGTGLGIFCFAGCTSLESISLPAIVSAKRKGDFYNAYATVANNINESFTSGYMSYWHNGSGPVYQAGIGSLAFQNCSSLKTVDFESGNEQGMFSYYIKGSNVFEGCTALQSLIFEDSQAYWSDARRSYQNMVFTDYWDEDSCDIQTPTYYFAVDYYASEEAAKADDASGSSRISRVEYKQGTPTSEIATSSASSEYLCALDYGTAAGDGTVPDAATAAGHAGEQGWAWSLGGSQAATAELDDSTYAYPVKADQLKYGRAVSSQTGAVRTISLRHLGNEFDPYRYYNDKNSKYNTTFLEDGDSLYYGQENACWFLSNSKGVSLDGLSFETVDGKSVSLSECAYTLKRYNSATGSLDEVSSWDTGVYRLTVTPNASSGLDTTSSIEIWVLVKDRSEITSVSEGFGSSPADTSHNANFAYNSAQGIHYGAPYAVLVGAGDTSSSLIAASYAGLVGGGIQIARSATSLSSSMLEEAMDGVTGGKVLVFGNQSAVSASLISNEVEGKIVATGRVKRFGSTTTTNLTASQIAAKSFARFNEDAEDYLGETGAQWGSTAILVTEKGLSDSAAIAAYAYAEKAPVFFTEANGTLSDETLDCLTGECDMEGSTGFSKVLVVAGTDDLTDAQVSSIASELKGLDVQRYWGDGNACNLSLKVAQDLLNDGAATAGCVSVCDASNPQDAIASLCFSGYEKGLTLVSGGSADSKRVVSYLHGLRDDVDKVCFYGRNAAAFKVNGFDTIAQVKTIWKESASSALENACVLKVGDTTLIHGASFKIAANKLLNATGVYYSTRILAKKSMRVTFGTETYAVNAVKAAQSIKVSCKTTVKYKVKKLRKLKKSKKRSFSISAKGTGKITYSVTKKAKKAGVSVSAKGKVTIARKAKRGTYKVTVRAAGNVYTSAATKIIKVKITK